MLQQHVRFFLCGFIPPARADQFLNALDALIVTKKPMYGKLSIQETNFNGIIGILYRPLAFYDGILSYISQGGSIKSGSAEGGHR